MFRDGKIFRQETQTHLASNSFIPSRTYHVIINIQCASPDTNIPVVPPDILFARQRLVRPNPRPGYNWQPPDRCRNHGIYTSFSRATAGCHEIYEALPRYLSLLRVDEEAICVSIWKIQRPRDEGRTLT
jgi:hypothetical protein